MVNNPPANAEEVYLIPLLGRPPVEGNGNLLQESCLGNSLDQESVLQSMGLRGVGHY